VANYPRQSRNRIVVEAPGSRHVGTARRSTGRQPGSRTREGLVAISVIAAAALATFIALFLTSRPYDPMNSTVVPQQVIPEGPAVIQPSPKQSPTPMSSPQSNPSPSARQSPESTLETTVAMPDDAYIQSQIEKILTSDPVQSQLDVSTLVENGKVTLVGSVHSPDMKQRIERAVRSVKGVISVDNQLVVTQATP